MKDDFKRTFILNNQAKNISIPSKIFYHKLIFKTNPRKDNANQFSIRWSLYNI